MKDGVFVFHRKEHLKIRKKNKYDEKKLIGEL